MTYRMIKIIWRLAQIDEGFVISIDLLNPFRTHTFRKKQVSVSISSKVSVITTELLKDATSSFRTEKTPVDNLEMFNSAKFDFQGLVYRRMSCVLARTVMK